MTTPPKCTCQDLKNCRTCYQRNWRMRNPEKVKSAKAKWSRTRNRAGDTYSLEYSRKYRLENMDKIVAADRKRQQEHPDKHAARKAVDREVRAGRLIKQPCEICQSTNRIHAHHDDYSKPLEVKWLCAKHHAEKHRQMGLTG